MQVVLVLAFSLISVLLFLFLFRRAKRRWRDRLRAIQATEDFRARSPGSFNSTYSPLEVRDYFIGDLSCRYNARSPHIRCAVNPDGPCAGCPHYQQRSEPASQNE